MPEIFSFFDVQGWLPTSVVHALLEHAFSVGRALTPDGGR